MLSTRGGEGPRARSNGLSLSLVGSSAAPEGGGRWEGTAAPAAFSTSSQVALWAGGAPAAAIAFGVVVEVSISMANSSS